MLASTRHHTRARRGIVLVLVLAMLGLLALIGVTFATFSGQARINARNYAQSVIRPQNDELMDFAMQQLITDTADPRSAIRGHSLARDMYGSDATRNGYLAALPITGQAMQITKIQPVTTIPSGQAYSYPSTTLLYDVQTNIPIPTVAPAMYGYDFTRWVMRVSYIGGFTAQMGSPYNLNQYPVNETCEILIDDYAPGGSLTQFSGNGYHAFRIAVDVSTVLNNPTLGWTGNSATKLAIAAALTASANVTFTLDGRWLHAFNGPGMGGNAGLGNFRFNGGLISGTSTAALPGAPGLVGMDEDYDACDLENWFLAIQSADGQVVIPSFHRPGIIRYDLNPAGSNPVVNDWQRVNADGPSATALFSTSASRILRPCWADGNDPASFPDLVPDSTGKITYDVDNDGDGVTDSVWLDLGYPARRDANGNLFKPLFAFMVIGLNGRIPLNTAGNLANGGSTHAAHLGNSVSEIDPQYGLQNGYVPYDVTAGTGDYDPFNSLLNGSAPGAKGTWAGPNSVYGMTTIPTYNAQVDNAVDIGTGFYRSIDVRTTQLRNLLAGTRPQPTPLGPAASGNGDVNLVYGSWAGTGAGTSFLLPNGISDSNDIAYYTDPSTSMPLVQSTSSPVAGRWGEAASIPGMPFNNPTGGPPTYLNLLQTSYANPVRAGYSFDVADLVSSASYGQVPFPRDAADDNYNAFDVFPTRLTGEVNDLDFYDAAGALLLPVERMRRFVTPMDINGTGSVRQYSTGGGGGGAGSNLGPDNFGRVQFSGYFRPAGSPGVVSVNYSYDSTTQTATALGAPLGSIVFPSANPASPDPFYASGPNPGNTVFFDATGTAGAAGSGVTPYYPYYLLDRTNNPFHGFESYKVPNYFQNPGDTTPAGASYNTQKNAGMPINQNALTTAIAQQEGAPASQQVPDAVPFQYGKTMPMGTYDNSVNSRRRLDGVNEADEMNLYSPNPLLDSPYGPSDLEWLYRQQDVDGASLTSRLSRLAPVSFTNTIDGQRRRRLYALDSWESNNFVWTNDNPGGAFQYNRRFNAGQSPSMGQASANLTALSGGTTAFYLATPALAQRDRKINLNYPLPVSNDCNEPVRQKWISETYQLLKYILPPDAVDTAEELAQLSQFVINIVDFRDPDATMTHWVNPDVWLTPSAISTAYPTLSLAKTDPTNSILLDQYGMEYNPVAINEVLAYSFQSRLAGNASSNLTMTNRFFIELVNTLTAGYNPFYNYGTTADTNNYYGNQASALNLGGFNYVTPGAQADPYAGGCWDLVFTTDDPWSRPDPYRGELVYNPYLVAANGKLTDKTQSVFNYFALIPLNRDALTPKFDGTPVSTPPPATSDATLIPINPDPPPVGSPHTPLTPPTLVPAPASQPTGSQTSPATVPPISYFYVIGNPQTTYESAAFSPSTPPFSPGATTASITGPVVSQYLVSAYDPIPQGLTASDPSKPVTAPTVTAPSIYWHPGILPGVTAYPSADVTTNTTNFAWKLSGLTPSLSGIGTAKYYWVCLRRPANPFAPVSQNNPMCVVDSMRFPIVDGSASSWTYNTMTQYWDTSGIANNIYSAQRLQPFRGGHAVPMPNVTGTGTPPPDPRYGYTEQICVPQNPSLFTNYGKANIPAGGLTGSNNASTAYLSYHSLGQPNDTAENWDYFVFNDRDFTSVAELMLVPGCPPGLFTKQFVEVAPGQITAADIFSAVVPQSTPNLTTSTLSVGSSVAPSTNPLTTFANASAPFWSVSNAMAPPWPAAFPVTPAAGTSAPPAPAALSALSATQPTAMTGPVQPRTYPYLVDRFFYTGASSFLYPPLVGPNDTTQKEQKLSAGGPGTADPSQPSATLSGTSIPVVGGPGADGWFKMFEFFEVPSQASGAVGPVAQGANFDWARQDSKPGLMNINLVIDEEAFYGIFGSQDGSYNQNLLNGIELPPWPSIPYSLPLAGYTGGGSTPLAPINYGMSPIPLVVTALQANGAPNYVYPIVNQGYLSTADPIQTAINNYNTIVAPGLGNRMKAAFAQFLWLRHGGSGYLFGFGNGATGQNVSVATTQAGQSNTGPIPAERPFRSLSFPDIDYTIMRPAALPPSAASNPKTVTGDYVTNAQAMIYTPQSTALTTAGWYWVNPGAPGQTPGTPLPNYYAPFVTTNAVPAVFSGDPGVRNPFLGQGYASGGGATPYTVGVANTVPAGFPLPVNVAFPSATAGSPTLKTVTLPPAIPALRLFQAPDAYGAGSVAIFGYDAQFILPPPVSNATDSGDPWINNQVAFTPYQTVPAAGYYALNNGFPTLTWPWMAGGYVNSGGSGTMTGAGAIYGTSDQTTPNPPNPATGVLPLVQPPNAPPKSSNGSVNGVSNLIFQGAPYYGSSGVVDSATGKPKTTIGPTATDDRQHPYWRTELLQRAMNLTTVRTHQYAVWITIGFFEIKRQGDIGMLGQGAPLLAFDAMGPEVGALNGQNVRYRGFFLVDRLKLTGFNPGDIGAFHKAIVYRKVIQ